MRYFLFFILLSIAHASSILLNTSGSGTPQTLGITFGTYGQGVSVSANTTLTQIGIWIGDPASGSADFEIWDSTNSSLLFSQTDTVAAASGIELLLSDPFSFDLSAGNTYYVDVIGPYSNYGDQQLGFIPGAAAQTQNGLSLVWPNSVYFGPSQPAGFAQGTGFTLPLELIGTQSQADPDPDPPSVPEPATLALAGFGCAALIALKKYAG
ncbi:MAG TPA: PEP-CTERM sorting domain-containing protein [Bryobacteraceae bacterium]|nr:PEP-CTERM sorting domain-containing protein [Bryobacteraceae bacterium]